jgi:hypothetical protein
MAEGTFYIPPMSRLTPRHEWSTRQMRRKKDNYSDPSLRSG